MADVKFTELPASAGLVAADIVAVVDDPAGTPVSQKATVAQIAQGVYNESVLGTFIVQQDGGTPGTDEIQISHDGTDGKIDVKSGQLDFAIGGINEFGINSTGILAENTQGPIVKNETSSATNPVYARRGSLDTGMGGVLGELSLITGGVEAMNIDSSQNIAVPADLRAHRAIIENAGTAITLALTDADVYLRTTAATAVTLTVPPNASIAFTIGTEIDVIQDGAGQVTFAEGAGVTINSAGGLLALSAQFAGATLKKVGTNEWDLVGSLA